MELISSFMIETKRDAKTLIHVSRLLWSPAMIEKICVRSSILLPEELCHRFYKPIEYWRYVDDTIPAIEDRLLTYIRLNSRSNESKKGEIFESIDTAHIKFKDYIRRLYMYLDINASIYLIAIILFDRLLHMHEDFWPTNRNIHRIFLSLFLISAKKFNDIHYSNRYFASAGGIPLNEMNYLEKEMLIFIDWNVEISPRLFNKACNIFQI